PHNLGRAGHGERSETKTLVLLRQERRKGQERRRLRRGRSRDPQSETLIEARGSYGTRAGAGRQKEGPTDR
ncbi:hypothetical protein ACKYVA_22315, partial [Paenibacillus larvae]|uniref:hypothetical protein n=1 Tax=Paenibacillus larvae TaxID=1464 RepID=UPI003907EAD4